MSLIAPVLWFLAGCGSGLSGSQSTLPLGDALGEWGDTDLTCAEDGDCFAGEVCDQGTCQVERCAGALPETAPPMGLGLTFFEEDELAFADTQPFEGSHWVDGYRPVGADYEVSWEAPGRTTDLTGGNFDGSREERYAVATRNLTRLTILGTGETVDAGFVPEALDAGDVDGDGLDELVAIAATDEMAICHLDEERCDLWTFDDGTPQLDVAVADIDGDTFEEPVILLDLAGERWLYAFNPNGDLTGEAGDWLGPAEGEPYRIAAGDLDGDFVSEVVGLVDVWWCVGLCDDELHVYDVVPESFQRRFWVDPDGGSDLRDLDVGDTDLDDVAEVLVINEGAEASLYDAAANGMNLFRRYRKTLSVSADPDRVAMADHDGNAPRATMTRGPRAVQGNMVPMVAMVLPPFDPMNSDGESSVAYGQGTSVSESLTDTVSLRLSADVGTEPSFFGLFGTKLSGKVSTRTTNSVSTSETIVIGSRYSLQSEPERYGPRYGGVVMGWGCFDAYEYEVDDPGDALDGADGEPLVITVPTGGGEALYSTTRYNAIADALGTLPRIDIPYDVGNPSTYPREREKLDGSKLRDADVLFPEPKSYTVSDVGSVSWRNSVRESETNSSKLDTSLGASAGVQAFGVSVGGGAEWGWGEGYSLKVGSDALFIGKLPALPDDPSTPEDEYAVNQYTVTPWVYQDTWVDEAGNEAGYWVMTYTVE